MLLLLSSAVFAAEETHWSLRPFAEQAVPAVKDAAWPAGRVDSFILHRLEGKGLAPNAEASGITLLRRIHFDLTGLPPAPEEITRFETAARKDRSAALAETVDGLLASPDFGVRWGRHWLDVARYAESSGNTRNMAYAEAWRYRNYVIRALNRNVPFDRFIREQVAGDLLPSDSQEARDEQLLATGFLTVGTKTLGEQDLLTYELNAADEQIDTTFRAFLALSANCARCHDHKFDPIPTKEYYALAGIFRSTKNYSAVETNNRKEEADGFPLGKGGPEQMAAIKAHAEKSAAMTKDYLAVIEKRKVLREAMTKAGFDPVKPRKPGESPPKEFADKLEELSALERSVEEWKVRLKQFNESAPKPPVLAMAVGDREKPIDCQVFRKGDPKKPLEAVPRGSLGAVPPRLAEIPAGESGRRQLADWIASPQNPLTARVIVNRIWQHVFGRGLVGTPDDFGDLGARPTHPELLDDLAVRFVRDGWNVKALIRELMLSRTYRLASDTTPALMLADPNNDFLARANRKPLEAEPLRDTLLFLSGELRREMMEGSTVTDMVAKVNPQSREMGRNGLLDKIADSHSYRSVFLPVLRGSALPVQSCFDAADPTGVAGVRRATVVPAQSLFLMNSEFAIRHAAGLARRIVAAPARMIDDRIALAWRLVFTREPTAAEAAHLRKFITSRSEDADTWAQACQVLMMTGEFRTVY